MHEKISAENLKREAVVYIRQSSMGQVRHNVESVRVQRRLFERAKELGWSEDRILVMEEDLGESASLPEQREGFEELLGKVRRGEVGMILASDVSRLARNNVDWVHLLECCAFIGVVIGDESQVYDPSLQQDSLVLGIQGNLAKYETFALRKRMEQGLREKALRGELHLGHPPRGYLVVEGKYLRKHPDRRVQSAVDAVFETFRPLTSIYELTVHLEKKDLRLPLTKGPASEDIKWVRPGYESVRSMLQNPKYAGIYAYPMTKVITTMNEAGELEKSTVRVPRGEWEIEIVDNHPGYISLEEYEENQRKMAMNANRYAPAARGAPREGPSLLPGLVYCRRCGHRMCVSYPSAKRMTYSCPKKGIRPEGGPCGEVKFRANEIEERLSQSLLYTVSPSGIKAAQHAAELLAQEWSDRRQVYLDACEHQGYQADLARRRFEKVDPENKLVFETLTGEYEEALRGLKEAQSRLEAFDREQPARPTEEEKERLLQLGQRVELLWYDPKADLKLKKQIVRTLIEHITADVDSERKEVVLWVKWAGGHHTEIREPLRSPAQASGTQDLKAILEHLSKVSDDEGIARILNRSRVKSERGGTWTKRKVGQYRKRHHIAGFDPAKKEREGWLTQEEAATYLGISPTSLDRLIGSGMVPAECHPGLPSVLRESELQKRAVQVAVGRVKSHGNSPLPENPDQLSLLP